MTRCKTAFRSVFLCALILLSASVILGGDPLQTTDVGSWVPNVGLVSFEERPLGDLWTFRCPNNARFSLTVNTKDDVDNGTSSLDPMFVVYDGAGTPIILSDDDVSCTFDPICTFPPGNTMCPSVHEVPCGPTLIHSIVVRDAGPKFDQACTSETETCSASGFPPPCSGGGGYELRLAVVSSAGVPQNPLLGGGPASTLPNWLLGQDFPKSGPALDDREVPCHVENPDGRGTVVGGNGGGTVDIVPCEDLWN